MGCLQNPRSLHKHHASFFRYSNISLTLLGGPETLHGLPTAFLSGWIPEYLWWRLRGGGAVLPLLCAGRQVPSAWISIVGQSKAFCGPSASCAVAESRKTGQVLGTSRHQQTVSGGPCRWTGRTKATLSFCCETIRMHWGSLSSH